MKIDSSSLSPEEKKKKTSKTTSSLGTSYKASGSVMSQSAKTGVFKKKKRKG